MSARRYCFEKKKPARCHAVAAAAARRPAAVTSLSGSAPHADVTPPKTRDGDFHYAIARRYFATADAADDADASAHCAATALLARLRRTH